MQKLCADDFQALTTLVKNFPKQMDPHLKQILEQVWNTLTQSAERYVKTVVNYTEDADDPVDSDGKKTQCFSFVVAVFKSHKI